MCVCVFVCVVATWCSGCDPEFKPNSGHFPSRFPPAQPVHPAVIGYLDFLGCKFKAFSHETAMVQVGLRVSTPLAVRKGLFSCEFLAPAPGALLARLTVLA